MSSPQILNLLTKSLAPVVSTLLVACGDLEPPPSCTDFFSVGDRPGYSLNSSGLAAHQDSETLWYRCPAGMSYQSGRCQGQPLHVSWEEATAYAEEFSQQTGSSWRLPSNSELEDLTEGDCIQPTLNPQVFGGLEIDNYWTSTRTLHNDMFRCVYYTQNGSVNCRELRTLEHPFMLIRDD
jgi:hypothetical protein